MSHAVASSLWYEQGVPMRPLPAVLCSSMQELLILHQNCGIAGAYLKFLTDL